MADGFEIVAGMRVQLDTRCNQQSTRRPVAYLRSRSQERQSPLAIGADLEKTCNCNLKNGAPRVLGSVTSEAGDYGHATSIHISMYVRTTPLERQLWKHLVGTEKSAGDAQNIYTGAQYVESNFQADGRP